MAIGLYSITSPVGKVYIGQSKDIEHTSQAVSKWWKERKSKEIRQSQ